MKSSVSAINHVFDGKIKHISRFTLVGVANTAIDFLMFSLFSGALGVNYLVSQIMGYGCVVTNSFILNRSWTFENRDSDKKTFYELLQFCVVNLVSLCITLIAMNLFVKNLNINLYVSKILVTLLAQITNFLGYKLWVFK